MSLVSMTKILNEASNEKKAIGAFMVWNFETAQAVAVAAQRLNRPVIFLLGERDAKAHGGFRNYTNILRYIAESVDIPIAFHADHFTQYDMIIQAIVGGYSSVMIDASKYPIEKNIELTKSIVQVAHACGVSVEAELGRLPGNEGDEGVTVEEAFQTDPDEAVYFVERTGIDALAICIGTAHGNYTFEPKVNMTRIKEIKSKVSVPLVMHGGSGTPTAQILEAIVCGIAKINVATDLVTVYANKIFEAQKNPSLNSWSGGTKSNSIFNPAILEVERFAEKNILLFSRMMYGRDGKLIDL